MPIFLVSGNPGSGKTLKVVGRILAERKAGRRVFVHGLNGLATHDKEGNEIGWEPLPDPMTWATLPTGSLVVIDEAQGPWPASRSEVPDAIRELSKHRHYGIDFLLTTQYPNFLSKYVRDLVDDHQHHVRRFGTPSAKVFRWQEGQEDVKGEGTRARAEVSTWMFPSALYGLYKSADAHTIKARIPRKIIVTGVLALAVVAAGLFGWVSIQDFGKGGDAQAAEAAAPAAGTAANAPHEQKRTAAQYAARMIPRVPSQPWSAPAFDDLDPGLPPRVFCASSEESCTCLTEQGTPWVMPDTQCRTIARWGQYDPFRGEREREQPAARAAVGAPLGAETLHPRGIRTEPALVGGQGMGQVW